MSKTFSKQFEVCSCNHVSLAEISYAIEQKGANTIEKIGEITDAGTTCKSCQCKKNDIKVESMELYLDEILRKYLK